MFTLEKQGVATPYRMLLPTRVKVPMKLPPPLDTRFAQFLQELPADYHQQAYEFKAFARPRKIKSPLQLLQLVLAYCGLDLSLRSCAGEVAQRQGYLSDTAVKKDWRLVFLG
jgi:hypothetical protein